jgi:DNA repair protein RAD5
MSDVKVTTDSPPGLFFASSDDEDEVILPAQASEDSLPESEPISAPLSDHTQTPAGSPASSNLFFAAIDEDKVEEAHLLSPPKPVREVMITDEDDDVLVVDTLRVDTAKTPDGATSATATGSDEPPKKKRRLSPAHEIPTLSTSQLPPTYLGDILVENAWSTVSGKGYVKAGESVLIRRDEPNDTSSSSKTTKGNKRTTSNNQLSITSMLKPKTTKPPNRKKVDTVVRILNLRGFGKSSCR